MPETVRDISKQMQEASEAFDKLCQDRHLAGAKEYGAFTFLSNDVLRMLCEELADTANYCRMQFIKLTLLEFELQKQLEDTEIDNMGIGSFKGVGEVGWVG